MINRTTITIRTRQRTVVRSLADAPLVRCSECQAQVMALTAQCAADMLQVGPTAIGELVMSGLLHATPDGTQLICSQSILNFSTHTDESDQGENL